MNDLMVSVVVPVYNMELYLHKCISSILEQTYSNYEIILVNDGSSDMSPRICDEYSEKYTKIKVIHKTNGGLSDSRNCGVEAAAGDYVMFVDADDYLDSFAMSTLVNVIKETKTNIAQMKSYIVNEDYTIRLNQSTGTGAIRVVTSQQYIRNICNKTGSESVCDKLFAKKILQQYKFEVGRLNEDFLFLSSVLMSGESIAEVDYSGYFYYQRPGSISHSGVGPSLLDSIRNGFFLAKQAKEILPDVELDYKRFALYQARVFFILMPWDWVRYSNSSYLDILYILKQLRFDITKTNLSVFDKAFLTMTSIVPNLTIACAKVVYKLKG